MAFSFPTDQARLQKVLNLDRYQLEDGSTLRSLMDAVDDFDSENSTAIADEIVGYLDEIDTPTTGLWALIAADTENVRSVSNAGEYSVVYGDGGSVAKLNMKVKVAKQNILALLDPDGVFYERDKCFSKRDDYRYRQNRWYPA